MSLNEVQKQAVVQTDGPLLILASPGSGKTTTIIMRIGYLIEEKGVQPSRIKAVTFSKAAARDMDERFQRFFPKLSTVDFSTIHSLSFRITRDYFAKNNTNYELIEGSKQPRLNKKLILRDIYKKFNKNVITEDQMEELITYISFIKNKLISKEEWSSVQCSVPQAERILQAYETYKQTGYHTLLLDYDDMLTIANSALDRDGELLRHYQRKYDYVLTDESQDTSMVQHAIIEKLVEVHNNLCVVADDDQSIYTWRAAEPKYLLNFKEVYPSAEILMMEQNYRSSEEIVKTANQFIKRNKTRYDKNMFTENPPCEPIQLKTLTNYKQQAKHLAAVLSELEDYREAAILFRNTSSSIILMNEFDRIGIPFYMKDTDNRFFSHWVVEDILNFMRLTFNNRRQDIFEKVAFKMNGYITKVQLEKLKRIKNNESAINNLLQYGQLQDYQVKELKQCQKVFLQMEGAAPLEVIKLIRGKLGYEKALEKISSSLGFRLENLKGILNTLEEIADRLETMEEFANRLKHLESLLKTSQFNKGENAVIFSTLHSSKGLEFKYVYMIDLIEGIIPSQEDVDAAEEGDMEPLEEAVRLFYVGMTRAESHLELISYTDRNGVRVAPSQFVRGVRRIIAAQRKKKRLTKPQEVPVPPPSIQAIKDPAEIVAGTPIRHRVFGRGKVVAVDDQHIIIAFKKVEKKLLLKLCLEMRLLERMESNQ